ncbi:MAG: NrfD/PsrC family molybdoenzyme membrane anchor subunit [Candidatus Palauibacterales bacterium]|nr:NrfD/PsrC family molybdoenzyme membrane anchor subunit [Candidatus Palauibacterales bacterium]
MSQSAIALRNSFQTLLDFGAFLRREMRPKGRILTPFNVITVAIMLVAVVVLVDRFAHGLGAVTNLSQEFPWGIWIAFDVITGVAFAGGAYVLCFMVYILGMEKYRPILRVTVLNGFLAYVFYSGALLLDLGRPWNVVNPIIGNSFGVSSVMFLVAWHFLLYTLMEFIEFSPAIAEWAGWKRLRVTLHGLTLGAVILGITLSSLHQSGLGALFLMARDKVHPLWYSEFIPIMFLISSVFAGLSMVIFEGSISHKVFHHRLGRDLKRRHSEIVLGLARICAGTLLVYVFLQVIVFVHGQRWAFMLTGWGSWYLVENVGFVLLPLVLFLAGIRLENTRVIGTAALLTLLGIVLNRLNISIIAFKWYAPVRYVPTWQEVVVTLAVISAELWVFRWIVNRMQVLDIAPLRSVKDSDVERLHASAA